jgi:hypothetical protein
LNTASPSVRYLVRHKQLLTRRLQCY